MTKLASIAIPTAAGGVSAAAVYLWISPPSATEKNAVQDAAAVSAAEREKTQQLEDLLAQLHDQSTNNVQLISRLEARLRNIEQSNQEATRQILDELTQLSDRQKTLEGNLLGAAPPPEPGFDEESAMERLSRVYEETIDSSSDPSPDDVSIQERGSMTDRFYEHGEIDEAWQEQEALIAQTLSSGVDATQVLGIECRNAVCKVDYKPERSSEGSAESSELEMINAVTVGMGTTVSIANVDYEDGTSALFIEKSSDR